MDFHEKLPPILYQHPSENAAQTRLKLALFRPCFGMGSGAEGGTLEVYDPVKTSLKGLREGPLIRDPGSL